MQANLTDYTTFYKINHQGHKLDWDHSLGSAVLKARFAGGPKDLSVSLYQALVLLLFHEETELRYRHILDATRMGKSYSRIALSSATNQRTTQMMRN